MINTRTIMIGALFAAIAALFQLVPVLFSELFLFFTVFSVVPIYIVSRISPKAGIASYLAASTIIIFLSIHEGLFFLCINGIVGMSLGICGHYTRKKIIIWTLSSIVLTITLSIINYGVAIPILGMQIPGKITVQILIIFLISIAYNVLQDYFSDFIYKILKGKTRIIWIIKRNCWSIYSVLRVENIDI